MAKPTRLRVTSERPAGEIEPGSPLAETIAAHVAANPPSATLNGNSNGRDLRAEGEAIIAHLRNQLVESETRRAQIEQAAGQRIASAEEEAAKASAQVEQAYSEATAAVANARQETEQAKAQARQNAGVLATLGLGLIKQIGDKSLQILVFLFNRLPSLAALYGGYLLWDANLADPTALKLIGLALFGGLIVLPTFWLAARSQ